MHGDGAKGLRHPTRGTVALEYSSFAVDGRPDLWMVVYNPLTVTDAQRVQAIVAEHLAKPLERSL